MVSVQSKTVWMKKQQCPCGDWKCFVTYEGDTEETNMGSQSIKNDSGTIETMVSPYVGMVFKSDDEAFEYYGNFARKNGFSIRKERSRLSPQLGVYKRDFVCYRSGFAPARKKQMGEHQRDRKSVRCGCDAKMYLSKEVVDGVSQWFVVQFSNVHNHELLEDDQVRLLPAYRKIQEADQERILLLSKAGFPIHRIVKVLELEKGIQGGQLSFLERDVRNFIQNRKKAVQENDALLTEKRENDTVDLLEACKANKEADPYFVYDVTVDLKMIKLRTLLGLSEILFMPTRCLVMLFTLTRRIIQLLTAFLRFMKGRYPQTIITDIDPGLREAIRSELPNTKHVISLFNILPRISSWFSVPLGSRFPEFKFEVEELCHLETTDEFEFRWNQMVSHYGINSDKHIALLFSLRMCWALPYTRGYFLARMDSISYWKSVDAFLKGLIKTQTCLRGFLEQIGLSSNYKVQLHEEAQYMHLKTCLPIEEHARSILTPFAFNGIQQEMVLALLYAASEMSNGSYLVRHFKKVDGERLVIWIPEDEQIHCSCKEFESTGILCRHALRFKNQWYPIQTGTLFSEAMLTKERSEFVHTELKKELTRLISQVRDMPAVNEVAMDVNLSPTVL
ncbi:hypothetical protein DH2020_017165 [Rehmannia glutinosa]|uniref:Protein FAR1-RELATED SEQUENCE n=1 Tax=Rehmannia glutinosa TaxID=99300 RepID=A0ABR0WUC9_REHGL